MTTQSQDLIPKKTSDKIKEIINPISPQVSQAAIIYLSDELTSMFRELSEKRNATETEARTVLARRQERILKKLQELLPERQNNIEDVYSLMNQVIITHFERQKGKKYL